MYRILLLTIWFLIYAMSSIASDLNKELVDAIDNGRTDKVKELLNKGADINKPDVHGFTPLIWATTSGKMEILKLIISRNADINFVNKDGGSALFYAVTNGRVKELQILLNKGANPNVKFMNGKTALDYAIERDWGEYPEIVSILKKAGAK